MMKNWKNIGGFLKDEERRVDWNVDENEKVDGKFGMDI